MIIEKGKTSNGYAAKLIFFYNTVLPEAVIVLLWETISLK